MHKVSTLIQATFVVISLCFLSIVAYSSEPSIDCSVVCTPGTQLCCRDSSGNTFYQKEVILNE